MITKEVFNQIVNEAREALLRGHLNDALFLYQTLLKEIEEPSLNRKYESLESQYNAMLNFLAAGGTDPKLKTMQAEMLQNGYKLLNIIDTVYLQQQSGHYLADCHNKLLGFLGVSTLNEPFLSERIAQTELDEEAAFCLGMELHTLSLHTFHEIKGLLVLSNSSIRKMIVSGAVLSLWSYFSPNTIMLLEELASLEPRCIAGLAMCAMRYEREMNLFPVSRAMITGVMMDKKNAELLAHFNKELYMCARSEDLERKIKTEILPILEDAMKDERLRMGFEMDEEEDPFEKMMQQRTESSNKSVERKKKRLIDSAMQLLDLQHEGVDINTDLFVNAMNQSFFRNLANWFIPFNPHHKDIEHIAYVNGKPNLLIKMAIVNSNMSDIDAYAFTLMMGRMVSSFQTNELMRIVDKQLDDIAKGEILTDFKPVSDTPEKELANFMRCLYRLFVKSRWRSQFDNLYKYSFNLLDNSLLRSFIEQNDTFLEKMGQRMQKYGNPTEALPYLKLYVTHKGATVQTLIVMASCQYELGKYKQAVDLLMQADLLKPDDAMIVMLMSECYKQLNNYEGHLQCLLQLEKLLPRNSKYIVETGLCLMKMERYQEAAQRFYKLELEEKKIIPSMRAIAWCSFKQQKYEVALRYYKKLYETPGAATWEDYLNGGHTAWLLNDTVQALNLYKQFTKRYLTSDPKITDAIAPFDKDYHELNLHGKQPHEIQLMHDMISND